MTQNRPINRQNPLMVRILFATYRLRAKALFRLISTIMGVDIAYRGYGDLVLPHPVGVVLHGGMKLGKRVTIYQNVTVASHPRMNEAAHIGDDAVVCAGAVLVGPVKIGARSIVGANAVVTRDVPDDTTVVGIPAVPVHSHRFTAEDA